MCLFVNTGGVSEFVLFHCFSIDLSYIFRNFCKFDNLKDLKCLHFFIAMAELLQMYFNQCLFLCSFYLRYFNQILE